MSKSDGQEKLGIGQILAERFRLIRFLDEGGLGQVWLAEDLQLEGSPVAIKALKGSLVEAPRAISDLKREVLLTRRLRHPNILAVYTFWETQAHYFVTMEYIEGQNLAQALSDRERAFTVVELLPSLRAVAEALDYAHEQGVLHRDVKPGNVMLTADGGIRLADFGIARMAREVEGQDAGKYTCGTVTYMSPEQLGDGGHVAESDQYSLVTMVYELLAGAPPFQGKDILIQIQLADPPPLEHLDEGVNKVLQRGLAKKPGQRYASCSDFCRALDRAAQLAGAGLVEAPGIVENDEGTYDETVRIRRPDSPMVPMRLGMILLKAGILIPDQLEEALELQHRSGTRLGLVLIEEGLCTEEDIAQALSQQLNLPYSALDGEPMEAEVTELLTVRLAVERQCVPLRYDGDAVVVAMADPLDLVTLNELESTFDAPVSIVVATASAIQRAAMLIYGSA